MNKMHITLHHRNYPIDHAGHRATSLKFLKLSPFKKSETLVIPVDTINAYIESVSAAANPTAIAPINPSSSVFRIQSIPIGPSGAAIRKLHFRFFKRASWCNKNCH